MSIPLEFNLQLTIYNLQSISYISQSSKVYENWDIENSMIIVF